MPELSPFLFFIVLGVILITAELLIFNLSVFWFLFIGIGALVAAIAVWLLPDVGWLSATMTFVVSSGIISVLLYKPLRRWQQKPSSMPGNDAIGQSVKVLTDVSSDKAGTVSWSGTTWHAKLVDGSEMLEKGETAKIVAIKGIELLVEKH